MGKDQDPNKDEVQREILAQKKFSLASAISRAESGLMKGESPLSQQEQAIIELTHWIGQQVSDPLGALKSILRCQVRGNRPLVVNQLQHPHKALQEIIETILSNDYALKEFVRQVDVRWGGDCIKNAPSSSALARHLTRKMNTPMSQCGKI